MEDLLIDQDMWDVFDANILRPLDPTATSQYDVMDRKVEGLIKLCLGETLF